MKAAKKVIFGVSKAYIGVRKVPPPLQGFSVDLYSVVELIVREQRLHKVSSSSLLLLLKLDGRPFWGNDIICCPYILYHHLKGHLLIQF